MVNKKCTHGNPLVVQWFRISLPMQEVQVQSLVRELRCFAAETKHKTSKIVTNSIKTFKMAHIKKKKKTKCIPARKHLHANV